MLFHNRFHLIILVLLLASCNSTIQHELVISDIHIIDLETGKIKEHHYVAIDSNRISAIYNGIKKFSDSTEIINGKEKFLIPGFWDMHIHYYWNYKELNPLLVANGITGLRDMWGVMDTIKKIRKLEREGTIFSPDIYSSGALIDGEPPFWPGSFGVSEPDSARAEVLRQIDSGVDFIKVYSKLSPEVFNAIAETANQNDISFAGHIPANVSTWEAAKSGMASAEHMYGILKASSVIEDSLLKLPPLHRFKGNLIYISSFDENKFDSLCDVISENDLWICPTLVVNRQQGMKNDSSFINNKDLKYISTELRNEWKTDSEAFKSDLALEYLERERKIFQFEQKLLKRMVDNGVRLLAGTDYPNPYCFPGFSLHEEMKLMVEGGLTELEALQTATLNPAMFLKTENDYGLVAEGKLASLVILNKNPLINIENTKAIESVILRGRYFSRTELDKFLQDATKE